MHLVSIPLVILSIHLPEFVAKVGHIMFFVSCLTYYVFTLSKFVASPVVSLLLSDCLSFGDCNLTHSDSGLHVIIISFEVFFLIAIDSMAFGD